jgi:hypothetical protein
MAEIETGPPMTAWRNELLDQGEGDLADLADQLAEATDPYGVLRDLKLPVPQYIGFSSVGQFMDNPDEHLAGLSKIGISNFYVGLRTDVVGWPKFRTTKPIEWDDVVPYITENVQPDRYDKYMLRVAEYVVAEAGVTLIVNRPVISSREDTAGTGAVHLDIIKGDLGPLATGYAAPDFRATTDAHGILRYYEGAAPPIDGRDVPLPNDEDSFLNIPMRTAIWRGISAIPKVFGRQRLPGYYEFAVVDHGGMLLPLFVDAKPRTDSGSFYDVPV